MCGHVRVCACVCVCVHQEMIVEKVAVAPLSCGEVFVDVMVEAQKVRLVCLACVSSDGEAGV